MKLALEDAEAARRRSWPNTRTLQARHRETFEITIEALILDLWICHLDQDERRATLAISRSRGELGRADEFKSPAINATLPSRLDELEATGWLHQDIGGRSALTGTYITRLSPGPRLLDEGRRLGVTSDDITVDHQWSPVIVKLTRSAELKGKPRRQLLSSPEGQRIRADMETINRHMSGLPLKQETPLGLVDVNARTLHRVFNNGRLDHGGRFFGAAWINMNDAERFASLRLEGQPLVKLDFKSMQPRIAYALSGHPPASADIYHLPSLPGVPREALKVILLALFWAKERRTRTPRGVRSMLPRSLPFSVIREAIFRDHAGLSGFLEAGRGFELLFHESEIMNLILVGAAEQHLPVLPVHDALYCRLGDEQRAKTLMEQAFRQYTGGEGVVDIDYGPGLKGSLEEVSGGLFRGSP